MNYSLKAFKNLTIFLVVINTFTNCFDIKIKKNKRVSSCKKIVSSLIIHSILPRIKSQLISNTTYSNGCEFEINTIEPFRTLIYASGQSLSLDDNDFPKVGFIRTLGNESVFLGICEDKRCIQNTIRNLEQVNILEPVSVVNRNNLPIISYVLQPNPLDFEGKVLFCLDPLCTSFNTRIITTMSGINIFFPRIMIGLVGQNPFFLYNFFPNATSQMDSGFFAASCLDIFCNSINKNIIDNHAFSFDLSISNDIPIAIYSKLFPQDNTTINLLLCKDIDCIPNDIITIGRGATVFTDLNEISITYQSGLPTSIIGGDFKTLFFCMDSNCNSIVQKELSISTVIDSPVIENSLENNIVISYVNDNGVLFLLECLSTFCNSTYNNIFISDEINIRQYPADMKIAKDGPVVSFIDQSNNQESLKIAVCRIPPTSAPTDSPTPSPTSSPTDSPTGAPTKSPTRSPSLQPTTPTNVPTPLPTKRPTLRPTKSTSPPTPNRTFLPTPPSIFPSFEPTNIPTRVTQRPTNFPIPGQNEEESNLGTVMISVFVPVGTLIILCCLCFGLYVLYRYLRLSRLKRGELVLEDRVIDK